MDVSGERCPARGPAAEGRNGDECLGAHCRLGLRQVPGRLQRDVQQLSRVQGVSRIPGVRETAMGADETTLEFASPRRLGGGSCRSGRRRATNP